MKSFVVFRRSSQQGLEVSIKSPHQHLILLRQKVFLLED
jgi:hypothetical protein